LWWLLLLLLLLWWWWLNCLLCLHFRLFLLLSEVCFQAVHNAFPVQPSSEHLGPNPRRLCGGSRRKGVDDDDKRLAA
jgi:hypothetical protein